MTLGLASTAVGEVRGRDGHTTFIGRDALTGMGVSERR